MIQLLGCAAEVQFPSSSGRKTPETGSQTDPEHMIPFLKDPEPSVPGKGGSQCNRAIYRIVRHDSWRASDHSGGPMFPRTKNKKNILCTSVESIHLKIYK